MQVMMRLVSTAALHTRVEYRKKVPKHAFNCIYKFLFNLLSIYQIMAAAKFSLTISCCSAKVCMGKNLKGGMNSISYC